jgi:hypothetical protein
MIINGRMTCSNFGGIWTSVGSGTGVGAGGGRIVERGA